MSYKNLDLASYSYEGITRRPQTRPHNDFWVTQIMHARHALRAGHSDSQRALGYTLFQAYTQGSLVSYLRESLSLFRDLHHRTCSAQSLLDLGQVLLAEHRRTGQIMAIDEVLMAHDGPFIPHTSLQAKLSVQLAEALLARYQVLGEPSDILRVRQLVKMSAPPPEFDHAHRVAVVAWYHLLAERTNLDIDVLEGQKALEDLLRSLNSQSSSTVSLYLVVAGLELMTIRRLNTHSFEYMLCAITFATTLLQNRACATSDQFPLMKGLFELHMRLAITPPNQAHLDKAKEAASELLRFVDVSDSDKCIAHWAMGNWLTTRFHYFKIGGTGALEHAIAHLRTALDICSSPPRHTMRLRYLSALTATLGRLFELTGARSNLDEAFALAKQNHDIIAYSPALVINTAGNVMERIRSGRLTTASQKSMVEYVADVLDAALRRTQSSWRALLLVLLNRIYVFQVNLGAPVSKERHLSTARAALAACDEGPNRHLCALHLADVLLSIAIAERDTEALSESFSVIDSIQPEWTELSGHVHSDQDVSARSRCHLVRFKLCGDAKDSQQAWQLLELALGETRRSLIGRLQMATSWARFVADADAALALRAYRRAVELLPGLAHLGQDIKTRIEAVQLAEGIASKVTLPALAVGDVSGAVELLEQSRGVVWSQLLRLQVAHDQIPTQHVEKFTQLIVALRSCPSMGNTERQKKAAGLCEVIEKIRLVEGYERFLLPQAYAGLSTCSSGGIVVLVIPSDNASDIIIIPKPGSEPQHLQLPAMKLKRLQHLTSDLKRMGAHSREALDSMRLKLKKQEVAETRNGRADTYLDVLSELWTHLVYPVIMYLQIKHQKGTDAVSRPRLWWCPVGVFAELPLHAAGVYKGTHQHCLSDYVVSSYTPTLSALVNARMEQDGPGSDRILLVSLPDVKDLSPIPKAAEEADVIKRTVPSGSLTCLSGDQASVQTTTLSNDQASIQNVMEKLPGAAVLHLACHGHQSQDDPLSSGFSLHDGRLRLEQLMSLQMPKAQLAYLSACETASVDKNQPDEAINLASTMLFVGFRSVIATMWSMNDFDGPFIAKRVYERIFRDGKLDLGTVPHALDAAVRELRETGADPSRWATYVHIGA